MQMSTTTTTRTPLLTASVDVILPIPGSLEDPVGSAVAVAAAIDGIDAFASPRLGRVAMVGDEISLAYALDALQVRGLVDTDSIPAVYPSAL